MGNVDDWIILIFVDNNAAQAVDDAVTFDRSMEARSASVDWGFYDESIILFTHAQALTTIYETMNVRKLDSEKVGTSKAESDKLTRARKASWATDSKIIVSVVDREHRTSSQVDLYREI